MGFLRPGDVLFGLLGLRLGLGGAVLGFAGDLAGLGSPALCLREALTGLFGLRLGLGETLLGLGDALTSFSAFASASWARWFASSSFASASRTRASASLARDCASSSRESRAGWGVGAGVSLMIRGIICVSMVDSSETVWSFR